MKVVFHFLIFLICTPALALDPCFEQARLIADPIQFDKMVSTCAKKKLKRISTQNCLQIAKGMQYGIHADELRLSCLEAKSTNIGKSCLSIQEQIESPDLADEIAWSCVRNQRHAISPQLCIEMAQNLSTEPQEVRMLYFCRDELEQKVSIQECELISSLLGETENKLRTNKLCQKK
ncbi:MAG: hypothetical protein ACLGGX_09690 [Bdellovibrionia bacterium]